MRTKLLTTIGLAVAGSLITTGVPATAHATTRPHSSVAHTSALTPAQKAQIRLDRRLAERYTSGPQSSPHFNANAATSGGMDQRFANAYASRIASVESGEVHPDGTWEVVGCVVATAGASIAEAAMIVSIYATGGADALLVAGYSAAMVGWVVDCWGAGH